MQLLTEKDLAAELEIDRRMLSLSEGKTHPPSDVTAQSYENNPNREHAEKLTKLLCGTVPKYDADMAHKAAMQNWAGDTLSDVAILDIRRSGKDPHQVIEQFLTGGIDAVDDPSSELQEIWKQVSEEPEWLDWDKLELGAKVYRGYAEYGFQFQGIATLDSYRNRGAARTLMSTGQYSDETAFKRFLLTCNFWSDVSDPGSMRTFGKGWKTALRVRLLHTLIRRAVFGSERWQPEDFGMPINQAGLMGAPLLGSFVMGVSSKKLGWKLTDEEVEAQMHLWRYISYVMGYDNSVIPFPDSIEDGQKVLFHLALTNNPSDDPDCMRLCKSFIDCFEPAKDLKGIEKLKRWWEHKANLAMTTIFVSPDTQKKAKLPRTVFWGIIYYLTTVPVNYIRSSRRLNNPIYAEKLDKKMTKRRRDWVNRQLDEADLVYRPASKF